MTNKGKILAVCILAAILCGGGFLIYNKLGSKNSNIEDEIIEQLNLQPSEAIESNESESYIELGDESPLIEVQDLIIEKLKIDVEEKKESSLVLHIKSADLSKIVEGSTDSGKIIEMLKSEDCPMKETKIEVKYKDEDGTPVIEKNAELFDAVFGGLPSVYGLGGNE